MGGAKDSYPDKNTYYSLSARNSINGIACAERAKPEGVEYFKWVIKNVKL